MSSESRAQGVSTRFGIADFGGVVRRLLATARFSTDCRLWISPSVNACQINRRRPKTTGRCAGYIRNLICSDGLSWPIFPVEGGNAGWEPDYQNLFVSAAEPDVPAGRDINWKRGRRGRPVEVIGGHPGLRGVGAAGVTNSQQGYVRM